MKLPWTSQRVYQEALLSQRQNLRAIRKQLKRQAQPLPSFLLLGNSLAGKTALLRESGISFTDIIPTPNVHAQDDAVDTKTCTGLFSEQGLYIDVPGKLLTQPEKKNLWLDLLKSLKSLQNASPIAAVILVVELSALSKDHADYSQLKQNLLELSHYLKKPCPLLLVFSQCDRISGFSEFFAHLSPLERAQLWGCDLTQSGTVTIQFQSSYNELLLQLRQRLSQQLHYEKQAQSRYKIFTFPNQMEILQAPITHILYELGDTASYRNKLTIKGVYFTSAKQLTNAAQHVDVLAKQLRPSLGLATAVTVNLNMDTAQFSQPYFISKLLGRYLPNLFINTTNTSRWLETMVYMGTGTFLIISAIYATQFYQQQLHLLSSAQAALSRYQALSGLAAEESKDATQITQKTALNLQALAALSQANSLLTQSKLTWLQALVDKNTSLTLPAYTQKTLQRALQQTFGPQLKSCLEHDLLVTGSDPDKVYTQLKTYLMLAEPKHREIPQLSKAITACWAGELNHLSTTATNLPTHLTATLAQTLPVMALNRAVITFARTQLENLQPSLLAYLVLKDQASAEAALSLPISTAPDPLGNLLFAPRKINPIPYLYTAKGFQQVFSGQLQAAVHTAVKGNWVLGSKVKPLPENLDGDLLLQQVSELYLNDYANWWDTSLAAFEMVKIKDIQQAAGVLKRLSQTTSLLQQLLQLVATNTDSQTLLANLPQDSTLLNPHMRAQIQAILGNRFQNLAAFGRDPTQNYEEIKAQVNKKINNLSTFIDKLANEKNSQQALFKATADYLESTDVNHPLTQMLQQAKQIPMPLQRWLLDITYNIWNILATSTKKTLNTAWQAEVIPYGNTLKNCYPLVKNVDTDCRLSDFSHFFAPTGVLANYFQHYLQPFIDTSKSVWHWRSKDGLQLQLADNLLSLFVRARIISKMYFPANKNQLDISFTLQPINFAANISSFKLTLNGQSLHDQPGMDTITALHWPGKNAHEQTSFSFTNNANNDEVTTSIDGAWAWFRLLDSLKVIPTSNPKRYIVVFQNKDDYSKYQLLAKEAVNPFVGGIVDQFHCPETL